MYNIENMTEEQILEATYEATKNYLDEDSASAYGINFVNGEFVVTQLKENEDIYNLIEELNDDKLQFIFDYTSFITYGWAAPLDSDGEIKGSPSEHPEKRRIRLMVTASRKESRILGNALKFKDSEEVIYDMAEGTGALADAINGIMVA